MEIFPIIALVVSFGVSVLLLHFYNRRFKKIREMKKEQWDDFVKKILKAFQDEVINNYKDIVDLFDGHRISINFSRGKIWNINKLLKEVKLSHIIQTSLRKDEKNSVLKKINLIISESDEIVSQQEVNIPFEKVPAEERNILLDLLNYHQLKNDEYIFTKLKSLSALIIVREETLKKLSEENAESLKITKRSYYLAAISIFITIALAVYSFLK
ncbi:MAG: hypothetical protein KF816_17085 [Melioribacteraceae bacterium]|nr:hypothetical protein [Melioribacteraceae bacterium]